jgi:hypothetical protein
MIIGVRMVYLQKVHFEKAEEYFQEANWKLAIREYDFTMHFYTPWSPYIEKSAQKLWQIGEMFEREGKPDWAIIAYSSIRSSFYASRSLYTPGKDWIKKCDEKIADLNVKILIDEGSLNPDESSIEKVKFLHVMRVDKMPDPFWSLLVEIGFFGWVGSVIFTIWKGFNFFGEINIKKAFYGIALFLLSFSLWVVALLKA